MASPETSNDAAATKQKRKRQTRHLNSNWRTGSPFATRTKPHDVREAIKLYSIYTSREPTKLLSKAVCDGELESVQAFIKSKDAAERQSLDFVDRSGFTALHYAAQFNRTSILELLLDSGANIDMRGELDMTALLLACKHGSERSAVSLLKHGAHPNLANKQGCTPLHFAALSGNKIILQSLLESKKTVVNATNTRKVTPLHNACSLGHEEICELLLEHGSQLDACTIEGLTPLHVAANNGNASVVKLLLEKASQSGLDLKKLLNSEEYKCSVLHSAVCGGNTEVVELLFSRGAVVTGGKKCPATLLHQAAYNGSQKLMEILIAKGISVDVKDRENRAPLHSACMLDRKEAIKVLRNNGAKLDENDNYGMTPFLSAVDNGHQASATLLLRLGADPNTRDKRQRSCIHVAVENEDTTMLAALLQETGPELLDGRDKRGRTPIHYAALSRKLEIFELLLSKCHLSTLALKDETQKTALHLAAEGNKHKVVRALLHACANSAFEVDEMGRLPLHYAAMTGRSKVCSTLLTCKEEIDSVDIDQWSPLLWAAKSGSVETVELLLEKGASPNTCDIRGNTALHVASFHGHVAIISFLLEYGVEILMNRDGLNCLDYAIENERHLAIKALVQHHRWKEIFQARGVQGRNLLSKLIEASPSAVEIVFDQCIQRSSHNRRSLNYTVTYDFRLLDPGPQKCHGPQHDRFFGLWELLNQEQESLLFHPLPRKLLYKKWLSFGLPMFVLNYVVYLLFVLFLTIFMLTQRYEAKFRASSSGVSGDLDDFKPANRFNIMMSYVGLIFILINMLKELFEMYVKKLKYFTCLQNLLDWMVYITGFLFLLAFAAKIRSLKAGQLAWQLGTVCIFLAYMNLILQTRIFHNVGLYVTMFIEVVKTLIRVLVVFMMFILAYSLVFYILFKEQDPFKTFGKSFVKTTVMATGEFDYTNMLIDGLGQNNNHSGILVPLIPFPEVSTVFFYIFMLTMPIVLMNLLIGLAVGDIELIRKTADMRKIAGQIEFLKDVESRYPRFIARWFYNPDLLDKPNCHTSSRLKYEARR